MHVRPRGFARYRVHLILFLFSDYSRSIVSLFVRSDSTNTALANGDSVVALKVKDQRVEFATAQIMLY